MAMILRMKSSMAMPLLAGGATPSCSGPAFIFVPPLDIATATKPQLDKALETLAPYTKEAVIAYGRFLVQVFVEEPLKKHDIRKARAAKELATALLALPVLVMLKYLCA
ncbi:hypothetical protein Tco_0783578 [Tanacetum coccineum]